MSIKTLIVDDEKVARNLIRNFISDYDDFEILDECGNGEDAVKLILENKPDLVFLDIQMPGLTGINVIEIIKDEYLPKIIFTTAYDKYAVKAFEVNAADYLLKPFDKERFKQAIERVINSSEDNSKLSQIINTLKKDKDHITRIMIKHSGRITFLKTDEIDWIESAGDYVNLVIGDKKILHTDTLNNLENSLDPNKFIRIHRSSIANIDKIKELITDENGKYNVRMKSGGMLSLSRTYKGTFFEKFSTH